ncbi:mitochondrial 37S ribosomal protein bS1m [Aspergillus mulundensis]|uniref:Mitochondrial ribosomal protein MRP51 n=1 Tax=Aspergillus mulundensis TaxID=1810919 RepID=A0A3D8SY48_9EURO|nr:Uncharacterized protein DSM5745_02473 [Aspergillus mulundensis]RDW90698.1 Uncharacterized protein DSM5745_02473 [Aspergillus mulundensis]
MVSAARLSPTAKLLRNSRLFALPQALTPVAPPTSRSYAESDSATLPHPIRASIVTPAASLSRGDWGLKRPLPAKSTSEKTSRPVVRINELDTFEHVTDFDSASDHTVTLEKFQELNMPISVLTKINFGGSLLPKHQSVFEQDVDNTEASENLNQPDMKRFRHTGPWLAGLTDAEFAAFLKKVQKKKPQLLSQLEERFFEKRFAEIKNEAQDKGEDLDNLPAPTREEFDNYLKKLRTDPFALGPVVYDLLDLPATAPVPAERMAKKYYQTPPTKMASPEYATAGPPITHPSAGLYYARSHASLYNHPTYGPQANQRPVEARILRPRGKVKNRGGRAVIGIGGIALDDMTSLTFSESYGPAGLSAFDPSLPGGAKYYVTPGRAFISSTGRIILTSSRATTNSKAPYGLQDYRSSTSPPRRYTSAEHKRAGSRNVDRLDQPRVRARPAPGVAQQDRSSRDVANSVMRGLQSR